MFRSNTSKVPLVDLQLEEDNFEDYGFYYETSNDERVSPSLTSPMSPFNDDYNSNFNSPTSSRSSDNMSIETISSSSRSSSGSCSVICEVEDNQAPITCRYFASGESVSMCIEGFHIVEDTHVCSSSNGNEVAEYKVKMSINGVVVSVWRRLQDFRNLAEAFANYVVKKQQRRYSYRNSSRSRTNMDASFSAWRKVERNRPGGDTTLSTTLIFREITLLKMFMQHALFECPLLELLVSFMR